MAANKLLDFQVKKPKKKHLSSINTIETALNVSFQQATQKNKVLGQKGMTSW